MPWASSRSLSPLLGLQQPADCAHMPLKNPKHQQHGGSAHGRGDIGWKVYCTASFTTAVAVVMQS